MPEDTVLLPSIAAYTRGMLGARKQAFIDHCLPRINPSRKGDPKFSGRSEMFLFSSEDFEWRWGQKLVA
jgi:hypothetical protein